jgi:Fic family protein
MSREVEVRRCSFKVPVQRLNMDPSGFQHSPVGRLVVIKGHDQRWNEDFEDYAFVPNPLPTSLPLSESTYAIVADAAMALGRLDAATIRLPNPRLLVRPALRLEAVSTSALEGTYATLTEVLEGDFVEETKRSAEVAEVLNYVSATETALERIQERPISFNLIAALQKTLVQGTRGDSYDAGRLRERHVVIGPDNCRISEARFIPTPPGDLLRDGVNDWEKWINAEDSIPLLVKVAAGHYQFETLHPFSDGNGRLGRLIAVLQLIYNGALRYPLLNISPWLERRRNQHQDHLLRVSQTGNLDPWIAFFCRAVSDQAVDAFRRIERLIELREEMIRVLREARARGTSRSIVDDLIGFPVVTVSAMTAVHHVSYQAANTAVARLVELGILREATGRTYDRVFVCDAVLRELERPSGLTEGSR